MVRSCSHERDNRWAEHSGEGNDYRTERVDIDGRQVTVRTATEVVQELSEDSGSCLSILSLGVVCIWVYQTPANIEQAQTYARRKDCCM